MSTRFPLNSDNALLDALSDDSKGRLLPFMKQVDFELHDSVFPFAQPVDYAYFPTSCIIHLVNELADGTGSEVLMVGREGFCGTPLFPASIPPHTHAFVIRQGAAFRLPASALIDEFNNDCSTRSLVLESIHRSYRQTAQTAACNRRHLIGQQLCRWLLMFIERSGVNEIRMTQERIANTLGVRREGISQAFQELQADHVVECRRGQVIVLDIGKLQQRSCECYTPRAISDTGSQIDSGAQAVGK